MVGAHEASGFSNPDPCFVPSVLDNDTNDPIHTCAVGFPEEEKWEVGIGKQLKKEWSKNV